MCEQSWAVSQAIRQPSRCRWCERLPSLRRRVRPRRTAVSAEWWRLSNLQRLPCMRPVRARTPSPSRHVRRRRSWLHGTRRSRVWSGGRPLRLRGIHDRRCGVRRVRTDHRRSRATPPAAGRRNPGCAVAACSGARSPGRGPTTTRPLGGRGRALAPYELVEHFRAAAVPPRVVGAGVHLDQPAVLRLTTPCPLLGR
jgi:hypothetical protein